MIADDWQLIHALSTEPLVTHYQSWLRLPTVQAAHKWVTDVRYHNALDARLSYNLTMLDQATHQRLGWIGWGRASGLDATTYDFGYALLPPFWRHGYMTEAVQAMLAFTFQTVGATTITGECAADNHASASVMEKAGLRLVAQWDELNETTGAAEAQLRYALTAQEWHEMQQHP